MTHGTPYQYASFCSPPESVSDHPRLRCSRGERRGSPAARAARRSAATRDRRPRGSSRRCAGAPGGRRGARSRPSPSRMRASRSGRTFASRCTVATAYVPGGAAAATRSRAIGASRERASAITSPTTSTRPARPRAASVAADRSSGQSSSVASRSTSIRVRSSGIERSPRAQAGLDVRDRDALRDGRPRAGERRVGVAEDEHRRPAPRRRSPPGAPAHHVGRRRSAGPGGGPARGARARRRRPRRARGRSAGRCGRRPRRSLPRGAPRASGAVLTNCGRLPTTVRTLTRQA